MSMRPTELRHSLAEGMQVWPASRVLGQLLEAQAGALAAVRPALAQIDLAAEAGAASLLAGHRMAYAGAGSSGLMALADCLELAGTFGIAPDRTPMLFAGGAAALLHMTGAVEDDPAMAQADLDRIGFQAGDVMICLSASGSTPYALQVMAGAQAAGARVVGIANVAQSPLLAVCDLPVLLETGPEMVAGSTRMGAATAQKVALNLLSVLVGLRLGHVHDGYMVNVVADNAKLIDRAARIVAAVAGCDDNTARAALAKTGGAVKPAVLVAQGFDLAGATATLQASAGHLAPVLAKFVTNE
jgi:N-acetylmuramic acid 6-phosphate etherase